MFVDEGLSAGSVVLLRALQAVDDECEALLVVFPHVVGVFVEVLLEQFASSIVLLAAHGLFHGVEAKPLLHQGSRLRRVGVGTHQVVVQRIVVDGFEERRR